MNRLRSLTLIGLLSLLYLIALPLPALAQEALYTISGRVQDDQKEALLGASVSLLLSDGKLKTGVITSKDGAFLLKGVSAGSYTLRISFVGYKTYTAPVQLGQKSLTLPLITLHSEGSVLEGVKVIGKTSDIIIKGDTIEYHAANSSPPTKVLSSPTSSRSSPEQPLTTKVTSLSMGRPSSRLWSMASDFSRATRR